MFFALAAALYTPLLTLAHPIGLKSRGSGPIFLVGNATLQFPPGQTALSIPQGQVPNHILLGVGTQNYTCTDNGTLTSDGATSRLYDISWAIGTAAFTNAESYYFNLTPEGQAAFEDTFKSMDMLIADHYFVANDTATGISPKFASAKDGDESSIIAQKVASLQAPNATNIDWLQLAKVNGNFSGTDTVFRVDTMGGRPPASCDPNTGTISVPYAAKYWFFSSASNGEGSG